MDKNVIYEYMDAKALVKETEEDIRRHRRKMIVQGDRQQSRVPVPTAEF